MFLIHFFNGPEQGVNAPRLARIGNALGATSRSVAWEMEGRSCVMGSSLGFSLGLAVCFQFTVQAFSALGLGFRVLRIHGVFRCGCRECYSW